MYTVSSQPYFPASSLTEEVGKVKSGLKPKKLLKQMQKDQADKQEAKGEQSEGEPKQEAAPKVRPEALRSISKQPR